MSSIQFNLNTIQKYKLSQTQLAMKENDGNIINKIEKSEKILQFHLQD